MVPIRSRGQITSGCQFVGFQDKGGLKVESHLSIESLQPFAGNNEELLFLVGGGYNKSDDGSTTTELLSLEHSGDPLSYCKRSRCPTIGGAMKSVGAVFSKSLTSVLKRNINP